MSCGILPCPSRTELGAAAPYIDSLQTFFNPDGCIFSCTDYPDFRFGIEICEDLWVASPPSDKLAAPAALVIVNCSAGDEIIGKADYRKRITEVQSAKNICAYLYCGAGEGEQQAIWSFRGIALLTKTAHCLPKKRLLTTRTICLSPKLIWDGCFTTGAA